MTGYSDELLAHTILRMISEADRGGDPPVGLFRRYDDIVSEIGDKEAVDKMLDKLNNLKFVREISEDFKKAKGVELGYKAYQLTELGRSSKDGDGLTKILGQKEDVANVKNIRRRILETLYEHRSDDMGMFTNDLRQALPDLDERTLHQEIKYLEQKNWVKVSSSLSGQQYLNFAFVSITAWGIDLVEDPEEFSKLFSINIDARQNHFGDIHGSNIAIDSQYVSQVINRQDDEAQALLQQLLEATKKKDKVTILKTLGYIGDKSLDLLIAIIAGGVRL